MTHYNSESYAPSSQAEGTLNTDPLSVDPLNFDKAPPQGSFPVIPDGTILRVSLWIRHGNYQDSTSSLKWAHGYATKSPTTGSVYLSCEYTVTEEGPYCGNKIWGLIGLHSDKSTKWADMGRSFIRGILNSARGYGEKDESPEAKAARQIRSLSDLNTLEFVARVDVEMDKEKNEPRNMIKMAITKGHDAYEAHSGFSAGASSSDIPYQKSW